jgi:hypothetical protein
MKLPLGALCACRSPNKPEHGRAVAIPQRKSRGGEVSVRDRGSAALFEADDFLS